MDSLDDSLEPSNNSEELNLVMVSLIKDHPVLMEKSQLSSAKERKARALQEARSVIFTNTGKKLDDKQILKKISNMKVQVKKKTDKNQTGNRKIILCSWEQELYNHLQGDENPTITKMPCAISAGFQTTNASATRSSGLSSQATNDIQPRSSCASSVVCTFIFSFSCLSKCLTYITIRESSIKVKLRH